MTRKTSKTLAFLLVSLPFPALANDAPGQLSGFNLFVDAGYESLTHSGNSAKLGSGGAIDGTLDKTDGMRLGLVGQGRLNIARDLYLVGGPTLHYTELSGKSDGTAGGKSYSVDNNITATLVGLEGGIEGYANRYIRLQGVLGLEGNLMGDQRISGTVDGARQSSTRDLERFRRLRFAGRALWELSPNTSLGVEPSWVRGTVQREGDDTSDFKGFAMGAFFGMHF